MRIRLEPDWLTEQTTLIISIPNRSIHSLYYLGKHTPLGPVTQKKQEHKIASKSPLIQEKIRYYHITLGRHSSDDQFSPPTQTQRLCYSHQNPGWRAEVGGGR